jgi:hypothetical protein
MHAEVASARANRRGRRAALRMSLSVVLSSSGRHSAPHCLASSNWQALVIIIFPNNVTYRTNVAISLSSNQEPVFIFCFFCDDCRGDEKSSLVTNSIDVCSSSTGVLASADHNELKKLLINMKVSGLRPPNYWCCLKRKLSLTPQF